MPAFVAFGRKWKIASDDFIATASVDMTVKTFWLFSTIIVYILNVSEFSTCQYQFYIKSYFYCMTSSIAVAAIMTVAIAHNCTKGSIIDEEDARKLVRPLLYLRLLWEIVDIAFNILGSYWIFGTDNFDCLQETSPYTYSFVRRYVICNWVSVGIIMLLFLYFYDPNGSLSKLDSLEIQQCTNKYDVPMTRASTRWENKCRFYCCFWDKSSNDVGAGFQEVGRLLAYLFQESNFINSDIFAGLIALNEKEKRLRRIEYQEQEKSVIVTKEPLSKSHSKSFELNSESTPESQIYILEHYFNYVLAVSGWKGLLRDKLKLSLSSIGPIVKLWKNTTFCCCFQKTYDVEILDDNCCFCNTSALKQQLPTLNEADLIYISFKCDYYKVPFFIALDHTTKSIVLTLRGTYSMKDIIADLSAVPTPFKINDEQVSHTFLAHHGMLLVAQNVKNELDKKGILSKTKEKYPEYNLVLVGQSLGGGSAAILGMMLHAKYNDLKVYAFNVPGCVMSREAAEWCEPFVTSVTYGHDMFARTSISSLDEFKNRLREAIKDCASPKYKIFIKGMLACFCNGKQELKFYSDSDVKTKEKQEITVQIAEDHNNISYVVEKSPKQEMATTKPTTLPYNQLMYLPGKIIHITENPRFQKDPNYEGLRFELNWAKREEFLKIKISPRMRLDHAHFRMVNAFKEYCSK